VYHHYKCHLSQMDLRNALCRPKYSELLRSCPSEHTVNANRFRVTFSDSQIRLPGCPHLHIFYYTMFTSLTRNALILSGRHGLRPGAGTRHLPPPRTHVPVTNSRQGRRPRQLLSGRAGCARGQMSALAQLRSRSGCCGSSQGTGTGLAGGSTG